MPDNFHFDIIGVSLEKSLDVAFSQHKKATHWVEVTEDDKTVKLILLWTPATWAAEATHPFPAPITSEQAVDVVKSWLSEQNYGPEPDHDGHNTKGWRVYNESWGHVNGRWEAFVAIEPVWLMHGK